MSRVYSPKAGRSQYTDFSMAGVMGGGKPIPSISCPLASDLTVSGLDATTFTRSTTATFTDYEGVLRTAAINEPRFEGGRRVENLCAKSNAFSTSPWAATSASVSQNSYVDPFGGTSAWLLDLSASADSRLAYPLPGSPAGTYIMCFYIKAFDEAAGTFPTRLNTLASGSQVTDVLVTLTQTWQRCYAIITTTAVGQLNCYIGSRQVTGETATKALVYGLQLTNITGSAYQLPSEYVPTAGAAASKWFTTKPDGSPIYPAPKLLMEGQSQNVCLQSQAFGTSPWTQTNITTTADSVAAPDSTTTADTQTATADNATRVQTFTMASAAYTLSVYLKRKTGTGAISLSLDGGSTYTVVTLTTAWQRFSITQTLANPSVVIKIAVNGDEIYAWGAQVEASPVPTSYIPTTTTAVTRTTDACSWPLSTALQAMLAAEGTISLDWVPGFIPPVSQIGIVSCAAAVDSILSVAAGASVTRSTDGTTPVSGGATLVKDTQRKLILRWSAASGQYQISSIASGVITHGTEGNFDGAFTLGTNLLVHYSNAYPAKYSGLKIFSRKLTNAELSRLP